MLGLLQQLSAHLAERTRLLTSHVLRPLVSRPPRVAVIGAGPAGAICARTLANHGVPVTVFDKGRGAGGRLSTRRADDARFDHGAQFLTARDPQVLRWVSDWEEAGAAGRQAVGAACQPGLDPGSPGGRARGGGRGAGRRAA